MFLNDEILIMYSKNRRYFNIAKFIKHFFVNGKPLPVLIIRIFNQSIINKPVICIGLY